MWFSIILHKNRVLGFTSIPPFPFKPKGDRSPGGEESCLEDLPDFAGFFRF
jgi:hypothetical protein